MEVFIERINVSDAEDLYQFELENRDFFERSVPSRGDDYYKPEIFKARHKKLIEEQTQKGSRFYLIKNETGSILGRINLVMDESHSIGDLGYRVGQIHTGKGIVTQALKLLLEDLIDLEIKQVNAQTTTNNIASRRILEKNGFEYVGNDEDYFEMNGQMLQFVYYAWTNN
ncbi:GNAT family N-acetyltransferase [Pseudalkalibacillus berkeleyi]|uniref:GNAT family N-acetyltransferase n=1 Tax=Pseudalkalibacillus berkeleyi TaxID=1069813 RepID=A0ABS9H0Z3_9BACL|nr:GNAT family protein [Pseudalkalibacillus berkeleyi]MCF6137746.1 GNAT family N-acetyltransferase [Pseudalkalibacillus berkeleyi]